MLCTSSEIASQVCHIQISAILNPYSTDRLDGSNDCDIRDCDIVKLFSTSILDDYYFENSPILRDVYALCFGHGKRTFSFFNQSFTLPGTISSGKVARRPKHRHTAILVSRLLISPLLPLPFDLVGSIPGDVTTGQLCSANFIAGGHERGQGTCGHKLISCVVLIYATVAGPLLCLLMYIPYLRLSC